MPQSEVPAPLSRSRQGRWLGGVCAGLSARWGQPAGRIRVAFLLASLLLGLGALVYLACWLILPAQGDGMSRGLRGIVLLAQSCAALIGLGSLAVLAGTGVVFGFGWVVVAVSGAILVGILASWPRVAPGWALLPIAALVLPSLAVASSGVSIEPRTESVTVAPRTLSELPADGLHSGLGTIEVDLRKTALPASGRIPLRIDAGVRRTLIALPHERCVHVEAAARPAPLIVRIAQEAVGYGGGYPETAVQIFGTYAPAAATRDQRRRRGPTLVVDFSSDGGSLVVRDYPDSVDPPLSPDWPGYPVYLEERPDTTGLSRPEARRLLRSWRTRREEQARSQRRIDRLLPGPCARTGSSR